MNEEITKDLQDEARKCAEHFARGEVILYPSDTLWGLGCLARDRKAVSHLSELKQRSSSKSFICLVNSWGMLQNVVADIPDMASHLLEAATEPITIVYPSANNLYHHLCADDKSISVRLIESGLPALIMNKLRQPILSTSANFSGRPGPVRFSDIDEVIIQSVDYCANPHLPYSLSSKASKIIRLEMDGRVKILR